MVLGLPRIDASARGYFQALAVLLLLICAASLHAAETPFTIIMLPDTQYYSARNATTFRAQTTWITENLTAQNIVCVTHVGDVVDSVRDPAQWDAATAALTPLSDLLPWGVAPGNHDYDAIRDPEKGGTTFARYFGPKTFAQHPWYAGSSPNGLNACQLFSGGGTDFLLLHLEMETPDTALAWADTLLARYPKRAVILSTHSYLRAAKKARSDKAEYRPDGHAGEDLWNLFIKRHPQVFLVLCGHDAGEWHQTSVNAAGGQVQEMLADYQSRPHEGDGWLRILRFQPDQKTIEVKTYSPTLARYETDADSQFTVPLTLPTLGG